MIASGWKLAWQKVFDDRIARPPTVDGSQMLLVERADARPATLQDTFLAIDPRSGNLMWKIADASNPVPHKARYMLSIKSSPKYWLLLVQYVKPDGQSTPNPVQYELVVDRQSGRVVFDSGVSASGSAGAIAISDDALFDYYDGGQGGVFVGLVMRRVDLPAGTTRWMAPWDLRGPRGLFMVNDQLINFYETEVQHYNPIDGKLIKTAELDILPIYNDIFIQDQIAVARSESLAHPEKQGIQTFDLQNFTRKWFTKVSYRYQRDSNAFWGEIPSITVTPDSIYVFNARDTLLRLDLKTGNTLWATPSLGPEAMSRPVVMNGQAYGLFADGTIRAFSVADGSPVGIVARTPLWYWGGPDETRDFLDLIGGLGVADNTLIVTTGCRNVFALQREP